MRKGAPLTKRRVVEDQKRSANQDFHGPRESEGRRNAGKKKIALRSLGSEGLRERGWPSGGVYLQGAARG